MRILFVDDREDTLSLFQVGVTKAGHQIQTASSGAEALEWIQKETYDIVVLDIGMPGMNGLETLEKLRQLPQGATVPVVIFSGQSSHDHMRPAFEAGASRWIAKPQSPRQVMEILEDVIAQSQTRS